MGETCGKRMQAISFGQLQKRAVWKCQLEQIRLAIPIGGKDDGFPVGGKGAIKKIEMMVDGRLSRELMDSCTRLLISQFAVL